MIADSSIQPVLETLHLTDFSGPWPERFQAVTSEDVARELANPPGQFSIDRLLRLLSPAAEAHLEAMAVQARDLTAQRFGKTVSLYTPLYLSNICRNRCLYCGFSAEHRIVRKRLQFDEVMAEAELLHERGFRDLLLVSAEDIRVVTVDFLASLAERLRDMFSALSIEVQQLDRETYRRLVDAGIDGIALYQETYDAATYARYHVFGPKADYGRRLQGMDDAARAGMFRLGLGCLLGLADWRHEMLAVAVHARTLMTRYWRSRISFSFPRIRPAAEVNPEQYQHVTDKNLVQMMLALRLCFADADLVLSTRELPDLRDKLLPLGITRMSAGSRTDPGGYNDGGTAGEQFSVSDERSAAEVARMIQSSGRSVVWKDWDAAIATSPL